MASNTEEKQVIDTNSTELTTDTSDIPQPFPAPLTRPVTPDTNGTSTADSAKEEPSQSHSPGQTEAVISQPILPGRTAIAPQITTATSATAQAAAITPVQASMIASHSQTFISHKEYEQSGGFKKDTSKNKRYASRKTGFPNLDAIHSFQPGVYLIFAETSAGKTTFALQWCDQIAAQGEYVLYFAYEQSRCVLMSKSVSRQFFLEHHEDEMKNGTSNLPLYTSLDIRNEDADSAQVDKQVHNYIQKIDDRMYVVSTNFNGTIDKVCRCIMDFIQQTGHKPVVCLDYIQLIPPAISPNGMVLDSKANIDQGIHRLKQFQEENDLTVIAISSVSRIGYFEEIALHHAKESGALEYTCDFAIGLQLRAKRDYHKDKNHTKKMTEAERRAHIESAKKASPRKIEAIYLKDRCGEIGRVSYFNYYSAYETFIATDINGNPLV